MQLGNGLQGLVPFELCLAHEQAAEGASLTNAGAPNCRELAVHYNTLLDVLYVFKHKT